MVWAAIWSGKRACVAADLYVRFKHSAVPGQPLRVTAKVEEHRPRLISVTGEIRNAVGTLVATGEAKYVPLPPDRHAAFSLTFVDDPMTSRAAASCSSWVYFMPSRTNYLVGGYLGPRLTLIKYR